MFALSVLTSLGARRSLYLHYVGAVSACFTTCVIKCSRALGSTGYRLVRTRRDFSEKSPITAHFSKSFCTASDSIHIHREKLVPSRIFDSTMPNLVKKKRCRVELHVHLDGAIRVETVYDLAREKGIKLPADSVEELKAMLQKRYTNLTKFLEAFNIFMPTVVGDPAAIERIAYEFCEDCAKDGIIYVEVRYCPHTLTGDKDDQKLEPRDVVKIVSKGLKRGQEDFNIIVRSILCCIKPFPEWSHEVLDLCREFQEEGVVGIDLAGDENLPMDKEHIKVFKAAKQSGIHRTVHAGENGSYKNVKQAVYEMFAERIGHGYHVLESEDLYEETRRMNIHFEVCPLSSYITGSVPKEPEKHPVIRFAKDNANFSINTDDPILTGHPLTGDYELVTEKMGLTQEQLLRAEFNAAESSFLPDDEKIVLLNRMKKEFHQWLHHLDSRHYKIH